MASDSDKGNSRPQPQGTPVRAFDLRTEPERLAMWCASLERRHEDLALRVAYLEMQAHRQAQAPRVSAETLAHRLMNPGEEPDEDDPED